MPDHGTTGGSGGAAGAHQYDVVIAGGGPGGSTVASLLKKYAPELRVLIVEKAEFPREHVGESQLPAISAILDEMGVWDKVEAANFPIKLGGSFTWGRDNEAWDLDFYPPEHFEDEPRPASYTGQRRQTAFQVDRAVYDTVLLDHARSLGTEVRQPVKLDRVITNGRRIDGLELSDGTTVTATHYVDATGAPAVLRRALGVEQDAPKELRNIAMYDYWENAEWAVKIGVGGTRILVRSVPFGWIWFIPLGPERTSVGLVCPSKYYQERGVTPDELYREALQTEPEIARLLANATPSGETRTVKDWSHVADCVCDENWFLTGEAAGFADPILSAGLTLTHGTSREVAYTILELQRGEIDANWLRTRFDDRTRTAVQQHIRFAQYWYSANGCFDDLKDHCSAIAQEAGVRLAPTQAWKYLAKGGFINHDITTPQFGSFDVMSTRLILERFAGEQRPMAIESYSVLKTNLHGAEVEKIANLKDGRMELVDCYVKAGKRLPLVGPYGNVIRGLEHFSGATELLDALRDNIDRSVPSPHRARALQDHMEALETMLHEGWVIGKKDKSRPTITAQRNSRQIRSSADGQRALEERTS